MNNVKGKSMKSISSLTLAASLYLFSTSTYALASGGMEGGGGNSYNGRPLESYIGDITKTTAYTKKIAPLFTSFKQNDNRSMFNVLTSGLRKSWFFIPGKLDTLPQERIGSAVPTEQIALQNFKEVWLDTSLFNSMSVDDQGRLILHEMLMGLRLLKLNSRYEQCLALGGPGAICDNNDKRSLTPRDLTPGDYADIRSAVHEIWTGKYEQADAETWQDLLARYNFSNSFYIFRLKSDKREITGHDLLVSLQGSVLTRDLPTYGFSSALIKKTLEENADEILSDENCRFDLTVNLTEKSFHIVDKTSGITTNFAVSDVKYTRNVFNLNDKVSYSISFTDKSLHAVGEESNHIILIFNSSNLIGFSLSKMICLEAAPNGICIDAGQIKDSFNSCLNQKRIKILK